MFAKLFTKLFGVISYLYFFYTLPLATTLFLINGAHKYIPELIDYFPYNIDYNNTYNTYNFSIGSKLLINMLLLSLFAVPHSLLARPQIKQSMNIPKTIERSVYVFQSAGFLHLILHFWQPITESIWDVSGIRDSEITLLVIYLIGYLWLLTSTFSIDHFELFGLRQSLNMGTFLQLHTSNIEENQNQNLNLITKFHYNLVRHPIMSGFFVMLWVVPKMTVGHLIFSATCSLYILLAVYFLEEPDLVNELGDEYETYKKNTPMYCPFRCIKLN